MTERRGVQQTTELERILKLPTRKGNNNDLIDPLSQFLRRPHTCHPGCAGGVVRLLPFQTDVLIEAHDYGGVFVQGPIGSGKTLSSFLLAACFQAKRPILVIPGGMKEETVLKLKKLREHWAIPAIELVTYEWMSLEAQDKFFLNFNPDLLVFDESHKCKNPEAAITARVRRLLEDHHVPICIMSGTPAKRSIKDFAHTMRWALRELCPLPIIKSDLADWASVVDSGLRPDQRLDPGALRVFGNHLQQIRVGMRKRIFSTPGALCSIENNVDAKLQVNLVNLPLTKAEDANYRYLYEEWSTPDGHEFFDAVHMWRYARQLAMGYYGIWWNQEGFQKCVSEAQKQTGLNISSIELKILNEYARTTERDTDLVKAVGRLNNTDSTSLSIFMGFPQTSMNNSWLNTTGVAIYAELRKPEAEVNTCQSTTTIALVKSVGYSAGSVTVRSAFWEILLKNSPVLLHIFRASVEAAGPPADWMEARKEWYATCRKILARSRKLDTEKMVASAIDHDPKHPATEILARWRNLKGTFTPLSVPQWVGTTALDYAASWAKDGGIIWTEQVPFALKLAEMTGIPYFGEEGLTPDGRHFICSYKGPVMIASWQANGTGRDGLQRYDRGLLTSMWPTATRYDQTMGRQHRQGQKSPIVTFDIPVSCREQLAGFERAAKEDGPFHRDLLSIPSKLAVDTEVNVPIMNRTGYAWAFPKKKAA